MGIGSPREGGGFILGLEGVRNVYRALLVLFLATIASGCGSVQNGGNIDAMRDYLRGQAFSELGVEGEGLRKSRRFNAANGKPAWVVVGCKAGDKGFTEKGADAEASSAAEDAGIVYEGVKPVRAKAVGGEDEATCALIVANPGTKDTGKKVRK